MSKYVFLQDSKRKEATFKILTSFPKLAFYLILILKSISITSSSSSAIDQPIKGPFEVLRPALLPIGLWNIQNQESEKFNKITDDWNGSGEDLDAQQEKYPEHNFDQLISHFNKSETGTFSQRYWYDGSSYLPGGPVIVLDGGETSGQDRIPFLEYGILKILSRATNGIGIILEHRYYGKSFPFKDLSVESLRYLTTEESLEDSAYFAKNLVLNYTKGDNNSTSILNVTAPNTPWIYYGGSYAGAKAAFMINLYPDLIWGSIASSAVVHAQVDFWQYYEPIRKSAPKRCINPLIKITKSIDQILSNRKDRDSINSLKKVFKLGNLTDDTDFVNILSSPLGSWQSRNWDPEVGSQAFDHFCDALATGSNSNELVLESGEAYSNLFSIKDDDQDEEKEKDGEDDGDDDDEENEDDGDGDGDGDDSEEDSISLPSLIGYINFVRENISNQCTGMTQDECFGTNDPEAYKKSGLDQTWRAWTWQVCNEWGYFQNSPPEGSKPRLISKFIDLEYNSKICKLAFGNSVPKLPNVERINRYGDFNLSRPRLVYIDGSDDPWLYATPHSPLNRVNHRSKKDKNLWLIKGGVHHWDENGLSSSSYSYDSSFEKSHSLPKGFDGNDEGGRSERIEITDDGVEEPSEIRKVHLKEIEWVKTWIKEFHSREKN